MGNLNGCAEPATRIVHEVGDFFKGIFSASIYNSVRYITLLSRGCSVLYETFLTEQKQSLQRNTHCHVMGDSGLLGRTKELAILYQKKNKFPLILIIDDIATHGRTLDLFLKSLEEQVVAQLQTILNVNNCKENIQKTVSECKRKLSESIYIEIFAHIEKPLISLRPEYRDNCYKINPGPKIFSIRELRAKTQELTRYIFQADVVNAAYTMSAKLNDVNLIGGINNYLVEKHSFFRESYIETKDNETTVFQKSFPSERYPKIIATIRILKRKRSYWIVPYIFYADLDHDGFMRMLQLLDEEFPELLFREQKLSEINCSRIQSELTALISNHLFLQAVLDGAKISATNYTFDSKKLIRNYGGDNESKQFIEKFITLSHERAFSFFPAFWKFLEQTIFKPLPIEIETNKNRDINVTMEIMKNYIYARSVNTERVLYYSNRGISTARMVETGRKSLCISSFLETLHEFADEKNVALHNRYIFPCLLYCMDRGYVAVIAREVHDRQYYSHCVRMSETSLSILPERYQNYIPLLLTMEKYCLWGWQDMQWKLEKYFGDHLAKPILAKNLWTFVRSIHRSGQSLLDWADISAIDDKNDEKTIAYKKWRGLP